VRIARVPERIGSFEARPVRRRTFNQRRAARPSADALGGEPDRPRRDVSRATPRCLVAHEPPESGDILLKLAVDDIGAVPAEIREIGRQMVRVLERWQHAGRVECPRDHGATGDEPVVIQVSEDELAGRYTGPFEAVDLRLRDAVMEPERLVISRRAHAPLFVDTKLGHGAIGGGDQLALCGARGHQRLLGVPVDDEERVQRFRARPTELPARWITILGVAEDSRPGWRDDALSKLGWKGAHHVVSQATRAQPIGRETDIHRRGRGLDPTCLLWPIEGRGHSGHELIEPPARPRLVGDLDEDVRGKREIAIAAGDESLNVRSRFGGQQCDVGGHARRASRR
jgi:hypothetical protein